MLSLVIIFAVAIVGMRTVTGSLAGIQRSRRPAASQPSIVIVVPEGSSVTYGQAVPAGVADEEWWPMGRRCWRRFSLLFMGLIAMGTYTLAALHGVPAVTGCFLCIGLAVRTAEASLACWQVRCRRAVTWAEFLATPRAWWPEAFDAAPAGTRLLTYEPGVSLDLGEKNNG